MTLFDFIVIYFLFGTICAIFAARSHWSTIGIIWSVVIGAPILIIFLVLWNLGGLYTKIKKIIKWSFKKIFPRYVVYIFGANGGGDGVIEKKYYCIGGEWYYCWTKYKFNAEKLSKKRACEVKRWICDGCDGMNENEVIIEKI